MSNPSEINAQQRKQQEQLQKMWQDNLHRQQMHVYYQGRQQNESEQKKVVSCAVCGSVLLIKSCLLCRRFFCNTHLPAVKFGSNGHQCTGKPVTTRPAQQQIPSKAQTKNSADSEIKGDEQDEMLDQLDRIIEEDDSDLES